jgi:hypothetical protein
MNSDVYEVWNPLISRIARYVSSDFPDIETEDLSQDLFCFVLERGWERPENQPSEYILRRVARMKAAGYRAEHLTLSAQYAYRTSEVRQILEHLFDREDWPRRSVAAAPIDGREVAQWGLLEADREGFAEPQGAYGRRPRVDGDDLIEARTSPDVDWDDLLVAFVDVQRAWQHLPVEYKKVLFERYGLGESFDASGERRVRRAVARLTDILNSYS